MEIQLQFILTRCIVNLGLTVAVLHNHQTVNQQGVDSKINGESGIRKTFQNLFDSISTHDARRVETYRDALKEEVVRERLAFDAMKEELQFAHSRNSNRKKNLYKQNNNYGKNVPATKRETPDHHAGAIRLKLETQEFYAALTPEARKLARIFEKHGYRNNGLRIVGGAVRDVLMGKIPTDLDFATIATPSEMRIMFRAERIPMFNTNGEKHGTINVRINHKQNFEITTLRDDVITDGRHAVVQFTKDWFVDATRRDLTINAMYLDMEGNLYDYYNGYEDLMNHRVIFVGDADKRLKEDYLRILRYFRFFGRIAKDANSHDEKTLQAIRDNASGLDRISGERIWSELNRIITGNFANELMKLMFELGLSPYLGLNHANNSDFAFFDIVCGNSKKYTFQPVTFIAALMKSENDVLTFYKRAKLSNSERDLAYFIVKHKYSVLPDSDQMCLKHFQRILIFAKPSQDSIRAFIMEFLKVVDREAVLNMFGAWSLPQFPLNGNDLIQRGIKGLKLGLALDALKEKWLVNDFMLSESEITDIVESFKCDN